ncbi:uncharacterized protein BX663DRAFT_524252 [Cokeromyces recurvatus]|uniref:uncharacterized protein n=1 Tax=Cokeromyces recurvatus TaxID=90255 RepID=UPI00221E629D|nr:uncharacterized protein BX663DRAFT_524252 [Cokeromyces recurvatus]KAI7898648.1 hypothetical protein BX663DRAFT_524252 [Cokeromyces recurvatus]
MKLLNNKHMYSNNNFDIQSISRSKLLEYYQTTTRTDLSIRKYVLITNLLREECSQRSNQLQEQQWFDTCINELDKEEEEEEQKKLNRIPYYGFYDFRNNSGLLVCSTSNRL